MINYLLMIIKRIIADNVVHFTDYVLVAVKGTFLANDDDGTMMMMKNIFIMSEYIYFLM
jgi:hypothetical protein